MSEYYLNIALAVAKRSTCFRRQYGAIIVKDEEIISTGFNTSQPSAMTCWEIGICSRANSEHGEGYELCRAVHAEQAALIHANPERMKGATLYLACWKDGNVLKDIEPCAICMRMIKYAGIKHVITTKGVIL